MAEEACSDCDSQVLPRFVSPTLFKANIKLVTFRHGLLSSRLNYSHTPCRERLSATVLLHDVQEMKTVRTLQETHSILESTADKHQNPRHLPRLQILPLPQPIHALPREPGMLPQDVRILRRPHLLARPRPLPRRRLRPHPAQSPLPPPNLRGPAYRARSRYPETGGRRLQ